MRHTGIIQAAVIAIGLAALGLAVKSGMDNFTNKDRKVTVKGLSEMEVAANKVTWPIVSKEIGNDLPALYDKVNATNAALPHSRRTGQERDISQRSCSHRPQR